MFDLVGSLVAAFWTACRRSGADTLALQQSVRDEINACISVSTSGKTTECRLLIFLKWKKQDLFSCLTWMSNDYD